MEAQQKAKFYEMLPVITFIISYFILHLFDWMEATQLLISAIIGGLTMFAMISEFKDEYKDKLRKVDLKSLNFYVGLLSIFIIILLINGILHWNRMIDYSYRMGLLFILMLIYLIILFRMIRVLSDLKKAMKEPDMRTGTEMQFSPFSTLIEKLFSKFKIWF
ncbi:MAG: hypothetical protein P8X42_02105 [Calditrichaceae bacterium]